jgi:hypothetical protein
MVLAASVAVAVPVAALALWGGTKVYVDGWIHVAVVSVGAAIAAMAAIALTVAGVRLADARATIVGAAFAVMATLLLMHGLTTPHVFVHDNGVVSLTGGTTLPIGAAILVLSAIPALRRPNAVQPLISLLIAALVLILVLGTTVLLAPGLFPSVPDPGSPAALGLLAVGLVLFGVILQRAFRTFLLTRRASDIAVAVGITWLAAALCASLLLGYWELGWWLGHGIEIGGIAIVGIPVALDLRRGTATSRPLTGDLSAEELVLAEEQYLGSHVRALLVALAEKDAYTEQHTRRVALRAVQVGTALGVPPTRLRALAIGGILHDIGKLTVPDGILKKAGPLTDAEFGVIRTHPISGQELLRTLGGFDASVVRLVGHHHERLDGSGYPAGWHAPDLDTDLRILAVCDVYDALVSSRVYRHAWSHEDAIALLRAGAGTEFDPASVEALARVVEGRHSGRPERAAVLVG